MKTVKIAALGFSTLLTPCLAFAVAPSGEMLERVNTAFLGNGEIAAPAPVAPRWAIQVGAFSDKGAADAQLTSVGALIDGLSQASRLITPLERDNGRMLYRARFGNLEQDAAQNICAALSRRGETCFVSEDETVSNGKIAAVPVLREALDMPTKEETDAILASAPQIGESELQEMRGGFRAAGTTAATSRTVSVALSRLASAERVGNDELQTMRGGYFTAAGAHFDFGASIQTSVNGQLALLTSVNWTPAGAVTQQLAGLGTSIQKQVNSTLANAGIGSAATSANNAAASAANAALAGQTAAAVSSSAAAAAAKSTPTVQNTVQPTSNPAAPAANSPQVPGLSGVQIQSPTGGSTQVLANLGGNSIQNIILNSASNQNIVQNTDVTLTIYNFPQWQQQITQNAVSSQLAHEIMAASGLGGSR